MGREIRRVTPGWEPPTCGHGGPHPQFNQCFEDALSKWRWARFWWLISRHLPTIVGPVYRAAVSWRRKPFDEEKRRCPDSRIRRFLIWNLSDLRKAEDREHSFEEWHGRRPDPEYYRPRWKKGEATWYQAYETVTEGTPITPAFETKEELIDYLVNNDCDGWGSWSRTAAERFVHGPGYAPTMMIADGRVQTPQEMFEDDGAFMTPMEIS